MYVHGSVENQVLFIIGIKPAHLTNHPPIPYVPIKHTVIRLTLPASPIVIYVQNTPEIDVQHLVDSKVIWRRPDIRVLPQSLQPFLDHWPYTSSHFDGLYPADYFQEAINVDVLRQWGVVKKKKREIYGMMIYSGHSNTP